MYGKSTSGVSWTRAGSFFPKSSGYSLFTGDAATGINISDSIQGSLGDCWMISTLASMAEVPARLFNAFNPKSYGNRAGIYSINMYNLGVPVSIVIDDYLPIVTSWGDNNFMWMNSQKELWPIFAEKAFAKLMGNYRTIEGGFPTDSGVSWLGTPSVWYNTSTKTWDLIWADVVSWDTAGDIMSVCTSVSAMGIVGGHCYSLISDHILSNGQKLYRIRNPWGQSEWTGAYADTDPIWATSTYATEVKFVNKNDGDFFMKAEDFKTYFSSIVAVRNPDGRFHSYWLATGNADTFGTAGTSTYCGATCKRNTFTINSSVAQTLWISPHVSMRRQYVEAPCTSAATSTASPYKYHFTSMPGQSRIWDEGATHYTPYAIAAGATITVIVELDWTRTNIQKDMSLVVWGDKAKVTIKHSTLTASATYPITGNVTVPAPEVCTPKAAVTNIDATLKQLLLTNPCITFDAKFTITMPTASWAGAIYDANHPTPVCTASGTNTACAFIVVRNDVNKFASILLPSTWNGVYTSAFSLI